MLCTPKHQPGFCIMGSHLLEGGSVDPDQVGRYPLLWTAPSSWSFTDGEEGSPGQPFSSLEVSLVQGPGTCLSARGTITGVESLPRAPTLTSRTSSELVQLISDNPEEGTGLERGARGNSPPNRTREARRPAHPLPALNTVTSQEGAKPSSATARPRRRAGSEGRHMARSASFRNRPAAA